MKQNELKPCVVCKRNLIEIGSPLFYRVRIEAMGMDRIAIQRQIGLELMLGSAALAYHMGEQAELAKSLDTREMLLCIECYALGRQPVSELMELQREQQEKPEKA